MPIVTILRGFKVRYPVLDAFLLANKRNETFGYPPVNTEYDKIAELLRTKMGGGSNHARVVVPHREGFTQSTFVYVAYTWMHIFAQRELKLEDQLPEAVPEPFVELRKQILAFDEHKGEVPDDEVASMGLYVVFTQDRGWYPKPFTLPEEGPAVCDQCGETFGTFSLREAHLSDAHGYPSPGLLPEC